MASVIFKKGLYANLPSSADGNVLFFCTDVGRLFQGTGTGNPLKEYSDLLTGYVNLSDLEKKNPRIENKLYATDDGGLYIFSNNQYKSFGGHTHANRVVLDKLSQDANGGLLYDGKKIATNWSSIEDRPLRVVTELKKVKNGIEVNYDNSDVDKMTLESNKSDAVVLHTREW